MRGKGYHGETCPQAIRKVVGHLGSPASADDIFRQVKQMGSWTDDNIWQCLMEYVINLPPSYKHWESTHIGKRFLFLREDGDYELYRPERHGKYQEGRKEF